MMDEIKRKASIIIGMDERTFNEKGKLLDVYLEIIDDELEEALGSELSESVKPSLKVKMLVEKYNRQGTEVLQTYNYSGVSETFLSGYSQSIIDSIESYKNKKKKVRFI